MSGHLTRRAVLLLGVKTAAGLPLAACSIGGRPEPGPPAPIDPPPSEATTPPAPPTTPPPTSTPPAGQGSQAAGTASPAGETFERIPVTCRADWGAAEPDGAMTAHVIDQITIHHTAAVIDDPADGPRRARGHQRHHQGLGWSDLAYHFLIGPDGAVLEGRSLDFRGDTATDYDPTGHLLISLEGHFDSQALPDAQWAATLAMTAWGCRTYGIDPHTVRGHRDLAATSCPGDAVATRIESGELARGVTAHPTVALDTMCG